MNTVALADLLRETADRHHQYELTYDKHHWTLLFLAGCGATYFHSIRRGKFLLWAELLDQLGLRAGDLTGERRGVSATCLAVRFFETRRDHAATFANSRIDIERLTPR